MARHPEDQEITTHPSPGKGYLAMTTWRTWNYSILLLVVYVLLFATWKAVPSRTGFVGLGLFAFIVLAMSHWRAHRRGYFVDRVDFCLHLYVVIDVLLECLSFEGLHMFIRHVSVRHFHDNYNFVFCALTLSFLIGGYRFCALQRKRGKELIAD